MWSVDLNSLLSGAVGGVIVLLLSIGYNAWQARKRLDQERKGLRRLIVAEVYLNDLVLKVVERPPDISRASTDAWDQNNARFAQLLTPEEFRHVTYYYVGLKWMLLFYASDDSEFSEAAKNNVKNARESGDTVRCKVQNYLNDPNFLKPLDQQDHP